METIKAKDLMTGNWVIGRKGEPVQVMNVLVEAIITTDKEGLDERQGEIHPILLTAEILKKNEIYLQSVGDNGRATPEHLRNRFEKWVIHSKWRDICLWYDRHIMEWHLQDMNNAPLTYVHELQQALHLCKMEKEIIL